MTISFIGLTWYKDRKYLSDYQTFDHLFLNYFHKEEKLLDVHLIDNSSGM
jgi:hypothetical protein